jgi:tetratricopeptide (TPR) repeat protein
MNRTTTLHIACLAIISLALFVRTSWYDFAYDDVLQIVHNPAVTKDPSAGLNIKDIFSRPTPPGNLYRPLTTLTYRASFLVAGLNQTVLHAKNVVLYVLCCTLVYLFFLGLTKKDTWLSFAAAALFTTHPTHVEVVANIIGRAEMLVLVFGVLAALIFARGVRVERPVRYAILSALLFLLACLSKESALTLMVLIPLYGFCTNKKEHFSFYALLLSTLLLSVAAAIALGLRLQALGSSFRIVSDGKTIYPENPIFHLPFFERLLPSLNVLGEYIAQTLLPIRLSADYSAMPDTFLSNVYSGSGIFFSLLPLALAILLYRLRKKAYAFAGLWFFVTIALTCNILTPIGTIRADRLLFLPGVGLTLFLACAIKDALQNPRYLRLQQALPIIFCLLFAYRCWIRTPVWRSNAILFPQTLIDAPMSPKAHYNMAVEHFRKNRLKDADRETRAALSLHPEYLFAARLLADISYRRGDVIALEGAYRKILSIEPGDETVQKYLSILLQQKKDPA